MESHAPILTTRPGIHAPTGRSRPLDEGLRLTVESDRLVAFGDGMESDALELTWGQTVRLGRSGTALRLLG